MREIPFGKPILGEEEKLAIEAVLDSGMLVHGSRITDFEAAFCGFTGAPYAVGVSSCTAALHLAYFHLGVGAGDEVIVPAQTHTATAHSVELAGARPVFVDAEPTTGNMDLDKLESAITHRTKAISVVHYLGLPVDMDRVMAIAAKRGLFVVEDCALALGAFYKGAHAGLRGDVGCFSFYPAKHITTAEGGMLITRHADVAKSVRSKRAFGMDKHVGERKIPGIYDVEGLGFNYRMSEIHAAIGIEQMKKFPAMLAKRAEHHRLLSDGLGKLEEVQLFSSGDADHRSSYYCHSAILKGESARRRDAILEGLKARGIGCSVYYPSPVPRMGYYRRKYGYKDGDYPVAARISDSSIALPVGPHLQPGDIGIIVDALKETIAKAV
jgi:dTDP-4-amino-4,6-dideoxygalactose transaminase